MCDMRRTRIHVRAVAVLLLVLAAACSDGDSGSQVASVDGQDAAGTDGQADGASDAVTEEEMLDYTQGLRDQGLDVEDPVVDADGNIGFGGLGGGQGGQADLDSEDLEDFREQFGDAQEVCGPPPGGGFAGRGGQDQSELQDTLVEFAECMRDHGVDVDDPTFDEGGQPTGRGDGFFDIDQDDPEVQAAIDECQDILTGAGFGPGARSGDDGSEGE
jgi:hypothetical protein